MGKNPNMNGYWDLGFMGKSLVSGLGILNPNPIHGLLCYAYFPSNIKTSLFHHLLQSFWSSLFPSLSIPQGNRPTCSSLNLRWVSLIHTHSSNYIWWWVIWVLLLNFVGFDGLFHSFFFLGIFFFVVVVFLVFWIFSRFLMFVLFSGFIPYFMR